MAGQITCGLTGDVARPVRCHILPLGLTIKSRGEMLFDMDGARPAKRRPGGWYDDTLVTAKGESVFAALDNAAISVFRKHGLMFSVRRDLGAELVGADYSHPVGPFDGFFTVPVESALPIKLFGLSLLWRVASSTRPEFSHVRLPDEVRNELQKFILEQRVPRHWEFPMILGAFNNRYEFADLTPSPVTMLGARFIRWCVDGVIVYVATRRRPTGAGGWRGIAVGFHPRQACWADCRIQRQPPTPHYRERAAGAFDELWIALWNQESGSGAPRVRI